MDDYSDLDGWLRLAHTPGVGRAQARKLLAGFGLPSTIFRTDRALLHKVARPSAISALLAPGDPALLARTRDWLSEPGHSLLTLADADYPQSLLDIPDPPLLLYVKGRRALLSSPAIAIVGSRNATAQGRANAERFAAVLSQAGLAIISGLALGIDTAAHRGCLTAGGATIAVIGTGADIVYPARNRALAHDIAAQGVILSEYPLATPGIAANFPRRNRIISGLSRGVLVIEAAAQSGSLITARMAGEQGRDVFAVPGSIHAPLAKGCHQLIREGALLVESAADILDAIGYRTGCDSSTGAAGDAAPADTVLQQLGFDPVDADTLALRCGISPAELGARLLLLEMEGKVELLPGGSYQRTG